MSAEIGTSFEMGMVVLAIARAAPMAVLSPVFGTRATPATLRLMIAGAVVLPAAWAAQGGAMEAPWPLLLVKELLVGAVLALGVQVVFASARAAGGLIWTAGAGNAREDVGRPMATLTELAALAIVFGGGGGSVIVRAMCESFVDVPLGSISFGGGSAALALSIEMFRMAVLLSLPALVVGLLSDVTLGVLSRLAPSVNAWVMGLAIKPLLVMLIASALLFGAIAGLAPTLGRYVRAGMQPGAARGP